MEQILISFLHFSVEAPAFMIGESFTPPKSPSPIQQIQTDTLGKVIWDLNKIFENNLIT